MNEFLELLEEYGLGLGFVYENHPRILSYDVEHILRAKKQENAFEGLIYMLEEMVLKVENYQKMRGKFGFTEEFDSIDSILQDNVCLEVRNTPEGNKQFYFLELNEVAVKIRKIENRIALSPEKFGINQSEIKLKEMFGKKEAFGEEVEKLNKKIGVFLEYTDTENGTEHFVEEMRKLLVNHEDNPGWYLEYGKKNKLFEEEFKKIISENRFETQIEEGTLWKSL